MVTLQYLFIILYQWLRLIRYYDIDIIRAWRCIIEDVQHNTSRDNYMVYGNDSYMRGIVINGNTARRGKSMSWIHLIVITVM
jgi:hypothetical protein